jgi:DNA-binding NarL/FixJ family response regulator
MTNVLIVDDYPAFRRQLRRLLALAGLNVVGEAGSLEEAETLMQAIQPDLAIIDVMLPDRSGLEGARQLKDAFPNLRVIMISAYANHVNLFRQKAQEAGAEGYYSKSDLELEVVRAWEGNA